MGQSRERVGRATGLALYTHRSISTRKTLPARRQQLTGSGITMASGVFDDALIKHLWSSDEFRQIFSDANRVQKWYDFEAALALEQAALGIIPRAAADEIVAKANIANVDIEKIAAEIRRRRGVAPPPVPPRRARARNRRVRSPPASGRGSEPTPRSAGR